MQMLEINLAPTVTSWDYSPDFPTQQQYPEIVISVDKSATTRIGAYADIRDLERRLDNLSRWDNDEFQGTLSDVAIDLVNNLVITAYKRLPQIISPNIASDGNGGVQFDWRKEFGCEVRLFISGDNERPSYLYFVNNEESAVVHDLSVSLLASHLMQLR